MTPTGLWIGGYASNPLDDLDYVVGLIEQSYQNVL